MEARTSDRLYNPKMFCFMNPRQSKTQTPLYIHKTVNISVYAKQMCFSGED